MVILQQLQNVQLSTFGDVSEFILKRILLEFSTVYFVTDQYKEISIKGYERSRRSDSGSLRYRVERREQLRPKQWGKYLRNPDNKTELVNFLLKDWSDAKRFLHLLTGHTLFVNVESRFYKLACLHEEVSN